MPDLAQTGAELILDTTAYDKSISDAIDSAGELDAALNDLAGTINTVVEVDTSAFDNIQEPDIDVGVTVDDSNVATEMAAIEAPDLDVGVAVDDSSVSTEVSAIQAPDLDVTAAVDDSNVATEVAAIDPGDIDVDANIKETEESKQVADDVHFLASLKKIDVILDFGKKAFDFIDKIENIAIEPILAVGDAAARIRARTGEALPGLDDLLTKLQFADLSDSMDVIGGVVEKAQQLHLPLEEASVAALQLNKVFDADPEAVLNTMNQLVTSGLVPGFKEAGDVLTVAFQKNDDRGGDLLSTINDNITAFKDLGLDGTQSLALINSGLESGFSNAGSVATALVTFKKNLTAGDKDVDAFLKSIGLDNPTKTGGEVGADFFNSVIAGLKDMPEGGKISPDEMAAKLFGKQGVKNTSAILGLSTEDDPFKDSKDKAAAAASEIDDSLHGAIDDFINEINKSISNLLSSDSLDIPGKIEEIKKDLQTAAQVLAEGGSLGDALSIGFHIEGFDDAINQFQSSIGNFAISVLELIAGVQDALGKDSSGTRQQIEHLAEGQLSYDLKISNGDDIGNVVQTALDRGVDASKISDLANVSGKELIAQGDVDKAQELADNLERASATVNVYGYGRNINKTYSQGADETLDQFQARLDAAKAEAEAQGFGFTVKMLPEIDTADLQKQIDDAKAQIAQSKLNFGPNLPTPNPLGPFGAEQGAASNPFTGAFPGQKAIDDAKAAVTDLDTTTATATQNTANSWNNLDVALDPTAQALVDHIGNVATATEDADTRIATALTDNTVTASFDQVLASADANFPGVIEWMDQTAAEAVAFDNTMSIHLRSVTKQLSDVNFLALQTIANVTSAQALGGGGTVNNNTTNNVTVNNNNSNGAQTANSQYQLSQALGGG